MIKGKKVFLKAVEKEDLTFVKELFNSEEISIFEGRWEFPITMLHQEIWFEKNHNNPSGRSFIICDIVSGDKVGYSTINEINWQSRRANTAIKLHPDASGKGYAYDAIMTLMSYAFYQMGLNKLKGAIAEYNKASYHLYVKKGGWKVEGLFRQHTYQHGRYYDVYPVSILRSEFIELVKGTAYEKADLIEKYSSIELKDEYIKIKFYNNI